MTGAHPVTAPVRRFPPEPSSVPRARRFLVEMLIDADPAMIDTAQLLVSELVTNAVLHAGTDIEVRVWATRGRLHVRVADQAGDRGLIPRASDADASTGRGLQLVELLAASYGVDVEGGGKTVWFELWSDIPMQSVRDSGWVFDPLVASADDRVVRLVDLPIPLSRAAQRHRDSLLRECKLHTLAHGSLFGLDRDILLRAEAVHDLTTEAVTSQIDRVQKVDPSAESLTVEFAIPPGCAQAAADLRGILDLANDKARQGLFLTRPALPEIREFRGWLLGQLVDQLAGDQPTPWLSSAHDDHVMGHEAAWEVADVRDSDTAMLAANDDNIIVAANDHALRLLGWDTADLVGRRVTSIIPAHLRERHSVGFTNFLLTGTSRIVGQPVTVAALRHDGSELPVTLLINVRQTRQGRAVFVAELAPATAGGSN